MAKVSEIIIPIIVIIVLFTLPYLFRYSGSKINFEEASKVLFDTNKQRLVPFLGDLVDVRVNQYSSFVITGERGSGKTRLWSHLKSRLSKDHLIIEPLQEFGPLLDAIKIWTKNTLPRRDGQQQLSNKEHFYANWLETDLIDFVIQATVLEIIKEKTRIIPVLNKIDIGDRLKFAALLCLYGIGDNGMITVTFIKELFQNQNFATILDTQEKCSDEEQGSIKDYLQNIDIISRESEWKVLALCSLIKAFKTRMSKVLSIPPDSYDRSKAWLTALLEISGNSKIPILIGFDGFDDISNFNVLPAYCTDQSFSKFIKSLKPLLDIASSNNKHFQLMLFIPECPGQEIKGALPDWRKDKVPHIRLEWDRESLIKYGNFIMRELKKFEIKDPYKKLYFGIELVYDLYGYFLDIDLPEKFIDFIGGPKCAEIFLKDVTYPRRFNEKFVQFIIPIKLEEKNFIGSPDCSKVLQLK